MADEVAAAREKVIEAAADVDDAIANAFLEGAADRRGGAQGRAPQGDDRLRRSCPCSPARRCATRACSRCSTPSCDYLPSPLEVPPIKGVVPGTEEPATRAAATTRRRSAALAFKVAMDEGRKAVYLRIYSGVLKPGDDVQNARTRKNEKVARLFTRARQQARAHRARRRRQHRRRHGPARTRARATRCAAPKAPIILERIDIYEPVIARAIEPKTQAEKEKLDFGLAKLADEDPTFRSARTPRPAR